MVVEAAHPIYFHEGLAQQEHSGGPVQHIEIAVAIRPQHGFEGRAFPRDVGEYRDLDGIVIVFVVRRELIMPLELAGIGIQRNHRAGVEVVAGPLSAVVIRTNVADSPIDQVKAGIERARDPR